MLVIETTMPTISISIPEKLKGEIDRLKDEEYGGNRSETVQDLLEKGLEYDELEERLGNREDRIEELEEQLARRSQIEERVDELAIEVRKEREGLNPPWPVRWVRWFRER